MSVASQVQVERRHVEVTGVVQGVGMRPHLARIATDLAVVGWCRNTTAGVVLEVEGRPEAVSAFVDRLVTELPPLARIDTLTSAAVPCRGEAEFVIDASGPAAGVRALLPPDTAVCADCLTEMSDPDDRRYRHPFITCTNCGPRLSITYDLPYDRPLTSLVDFPMCARCEGEYRNPADRRFHAQPIGCHDCGPTVWWSVGSAGSSADGVKVGGEAALAAAVEALAAGKILAIKGIGGYHLACDAGNDAAVQELRGRKMRPDKPFAVLVRDLVGAQTIADCDDPTAREILLGPQRPIVLLPQRADAPVSAAVAPRLGELGVMVAYAPLHHLILTDLESRTGRPAVLVMTSGNASGEPLTYRDEDAHRDLGPLVDGILGHNRDIVVPVEDSVVAWSAATGVVPVRRSRGYAPLPMQCTSPDPGLEVDGSGQAGPHTVLAAGAELKNTVAVGSGGRVHISAHVGDLETLSARRAHQKVTDQLLAFHRSRPAAVVADLHPAYSSREWARHYAAELSIPVVEVQHHHAHLASLAAEHGRLGEPLLGLVFDGTGYGCDGGIWGGELLHLVDGGARAERLGHLGTVRLPGGDAGVRNPVRTAALALLDAGLTWDGTPIADELSPVEAQVIRAAHERGLATTETTSMGRLFDVIAAVLGICHRVSYEAQAAIELEAAARGVSRQWRKTGTISENRSVLKLAFPANGGKGQTATLDPGELVRDLVGHVRTGTPVPVLAAAAHEAIARGSADLAAHAAARTGTTVVGLTGGVFVNRLLLAATSRALTEHGLTVLTHQHVPANDGGLALGQAAVGLQWLRDHPPAAPTHPTTADSKEIHPCV